MFTMYALFPIKKIEEYVRAITFENYMENETIENVIITHGINPCFLDKKSLAIHPLDILIHNNDWKKIEDINFKDLFGPMVELYLLEFTLELRDILIPLTRAFNSRFELLPYQWLSTYVTTLCDHTMDDQTRLSLAECFDIQKMPEEDRVNACNLLIDKYVFATSVIRNDQVKSIKKVSNPIL